MNAEQTLIELKPYSLTELATLYSVCNRTFKKWVKPFENEIGKKQGRYYTVSQVAVVFDKIGFPCTVTE
jgi:hypothetical protein